MRHKKGIELSVNFIVVLIISIVIFVFSLIFIKNLFSAAYQKQIEVDYQTEEQIKSLIRGGERVAIPVTTLQIRRGDSGVFGLGILNLEDAEKDFYINVVYVNGYDADGGGLPQPPFQILYRNMDTTLPTVTILPNKEEILGISIKTPDIAEPGTYIFNTFICADGVNDFNQFTICSCSPSDCSILYDGAIHKLYVEVP